MKKKSFTVPLITTIVVGILFCVLNFFNLFQKLDYRLYDALFHVRKDNEINPRITLINADDLAIEKLGEWPWGRDVIADVLIRLREFDARFAVFDIEYISPSRNGIAPSAEQKISEQINLVRDHISQNIQIIPNSVGHDLTDLTYELIDANDGEFQDLIQFVNNNISRDNDEYFAQALQFFGNAWLTVNHTDMGYSYSKDDIDYVVSRFLLDKVEDPYYLINIDNKNNGAEADEDQGFTPALHKLLTRTKGVSFTNSFIDNDGTRRRIQLLYSYDGKYLPQLVFGPYLNLYDVQNIVRDGNRLILKNAKNPETGKVKDIYIPLDNNGRFLINYSHKGIADSFKNHSVYRFTELDELEAKFQPLLGNIYFYDGEVYDENNDNLPYFNEAYELLLASETLSQMKIYLFDKCKGFDGNNKLIEGISDEEYLEYFTLRKQYFDSLYKFVKANHLPKIIRRIQEMQDEGTWTGTDENIEYFTEDFTELEKTYNFYKSNYDELAKELKDSYCIIGQTATSTSDLGSTPFAKRYENVGIHANILNTLLSENFIVYYDWYWGFAIAILLFIISLFINSKSNSFQNIINALILFIFILASVLAFVLFNIYIPSVGVIVFLIVNYILVVAYRFYVSNKEKKLITAIASSFANKDTVDELRKNPEAFQTKGEKKTITALFSDIQKFSTLSEKIGKIYGEAGPNKLIEILNEYLGQMSNEILVNNGTIDKYEGDAIISMFGAPDPTHSATPDEWAYRCLDSAIRMKKVEKVFNETHQELFKPTEISDANGKTEIIQLTPLQTRIGINSGDAFVGLMGSKTESFSKLNYTMIGDTVNLASRLEGVNKSYKTWIMCSGDTWKMANSGQNKDKIIARKLDSVRVVGKNIPVPIYNILGFKDEFTYLQREQLDMFNAAMDEYHNKEFLKAGKLFLQASTINGLNDDTSLVFAERCKNLLEKGCPEDWDFVINMTSK